MRNKNIFGGVIVAFFALASLAGCETLDHTFSDRKVLFSDTVQTYAVKDTPEDVYKVVIGTSKSYEYDRYLSVEVVPSKSTAIEGVHYTLEDYNAYLPAGQLVTEINIKGIYDGLENTVGTDFSVDTSIEDPYLTLRVLDRGADPFDYDETRIEFKKYYPFDIDDFVEDGGFLRVYNTNGSYLTKAVKLDNYRLLIKDVVRGGKDLIVNFETYDDPVITHKAVVFPQVIGYYDVLYPDMTVESLDAVPCMVYNYTREIYFILYAYVDGYGGLGYLQFITKWISEQEAMKDEDYEEIKNL